MQISSGASISVQTKVRMPTFKCVLLYVCEKVFLKFNKPGPAIKCVSQVEITVLGDFAYMLTDRWTAGHTDIQMDGRTDPQIEMRGCI